MFGPFIAFFSNDFCSFLFKRSCIELHYCGISLFGEAIFLTGVSACSIPDILRWFDPFGSCLQAVCKLLIFLFCFLNLNYHLRCDIEILKRVLALLPAGRANESFLHYIKIQQVRWFGHVTPLSPDSTPC